MTKNNNWMNVIIMEKAQRQFCHIYIVNFTLCMQKKYIMTIANPLSTKESLDIKHTVKQILTVLYFWTTIVILSF